MSKFTNSGIQGMSQLSNSQQESIKPLFTSQTRVNTKIENLWQVANRENAPKMFLRIKNGNQLFHNKVLEINSLGLQGPEN